MSLADILCLSTAKRATMEVSRSEQTVQDVFNKLFETKAKRSGRLYVYCLHCDHGLQLEHENPAANVQINGHQNMFMMTVCGGCERESNQQGFWGLNEAGCTGPPEGMELSKKMLRGWEAFILLREACAAQGEGLEGITRIVPRRAIFNVATSGYAMRTVVVSRTDGLKAKVERKEYLSTRMI